MTPFTLPRAEQNSLLPFLFGHDTSFFIVLKLKQKGTDPNLTPFTLEQKKDGTLMRIMRSGAAMA